MHMSTDGILFGMESLRSRGSHRMDGDINVDITADGSDPEAVEETVDAVETTDDAAEASQAIDDTATEAEMVWKNYDRIMAVRSYIAKNGLDRSVVMLHDYDGFLSRTLRYVPSMESLSSSGSPYSSESQAAMEGLGDAAKAVWEWIKKMCRKLRDWLAELWAKIMGTFENFKKQIARLRAMLRTRKPRDSKETEGITVHVLKNDITAKVDTAINELKKYIAESDKTITVDLAAVKAQMDRRSYIRRSAGHPYTADQYTAIENKLKNNPNYQKEESTGIDDTKLENVKKEFETFRDKINDYNVEDDMDDEEPSNAMSEASTALSRAEKLVDKIKTLDKENKTIDKNTTAIEKVASEQEKNEKTQANGHALRNTISLNQMAASSHKDVIEITKKICSVYIKTASLYIAKGTVSK